MRGIPGDILLALISATLAAFYLAMIWAGLVIAVTEPTEPLADAPGTEAPCQGSPSPAPPTATEASYP